LTEVEQDGSAKSLAIPKPTGTSLDPLDATVDALGDTVRLFQEDRVEALPFLVWVAVPWDYE